MNLKTDSPENFNLPGTNPEGSIDIFSDDLRFVKHGDDGVDECPQTGRSQPRLPDLNFERYAPLELLNNSGHLNGENSPASPGSHDQIQDSLRSQILHPNRSARLLW